MDLIQPTKTRLLSQPNLHLKFVCPGTKCDFICGKNRVIFLFTLQEVFGYQTQKLRRVLFLVTSVLTCGVLPLLFYWKPQWRVWAYCIPCSLQEADTVLLRTTVRALLCCIECTSCDDQHSRADPPLFKSFPAPRYNMAELSLPSIFWSRNVGLFLHICLEKFLSCQANCKCS